MSRSTETNQQKPTLSKKRRAIFALITIVLFFGLLEVGTRVYDYAKPDHLEAYKRLSSNPALGYELIPNYRARTTNGKRDAIVINSLGYRGDEFSAQKKAGTTRVICLGDSCTFEGIPEDATYPRHLQETLNENPSTGKTYEVINAAVEGYDSTKALERLKQSLAFQPDIVTIYIGWNDIYNNDPSQVSSSGVARVISTALQYSHFVAKLRTLFFIKLRPKFKTQIAEKSAQYEKFMPATYEKNLREMIQLVRANNAKPYLITLPCILSTKISKEALERAQFPYYTNSTIDMMTLIARYNEAIARVASETNTPLIDLAKQFDQMENKESYFSDTIHMYNPGKPIIAQTIKETITKD